MISFNKIYAYEKRLKRVTISAPNHQLEGGLHGTSHTRAAFELGLNPRKKKAGGSIAMNANCTVAARVCRPVETKQMRLRPNVACFAKRFGIQIGRIFSQGLR